MKISILSWNVNSEHYRIIYRATDFKKIISVLDAITANIICLQEIPNARERISQNCSLRTYYRNFSNNNRSCILSKFPILRSGELLFTARVSFPHDTDEVIWTEVSVADKILRVYNCHFNIEKIGIAGRIERLKLVLEHTIEHGGPTIVCGDMNTAIPRNGVGRKIITWFYRIPQRELIVNGKYWSEDERYIFSEVAHSFGFTEGLKLSENTWFIPFLFEVELFRLKLDWFLMNGVKTTNATLSKYASDHKLVLVECLL